MGSSPLYLLALVRHHGVLASRVRRSEFPYELVINQVLRDRHALGPTAVITVDWGARSDIGRVRTMNEDTLIASPPLFLVADGMGGHEAGEVASAIVSDVLGAAVASASPPVPETVALGLASANTAIFDASNARQAEGGMGTTAVGLALVSVGGNDRLCGFNVGDSRLYRMTHGHLRQISADHSYVQELVAAGEIAAEDARTHPHRNVVTRALGIDPEVVPDLWVLEPAVGERYLLCSDGLSGEVDDPTIESTLVNHRDPRVAASRLVEAALTAGGRDNVTVIVIDVLRVDAGVDEDTNEQAGGVTPGSTLIDVVPSVLSPAETVVTPVATLIAEVPEP
jgi:PPM family protein phosphatase